MRTAIRRAGDGDAEALALVGAATFLESFAGVLEGRHIVAHCQRQHSAEFYTRLLVSPDAALWLAEAETGGAPVGYCVLCPPADMPVSDPRPDDLEIKRIYLFSRFHGSGLARRMMEAAIAEAKTRGAGRVLIGVKDDNHRAIAFYRKCGFEDAGTRSFRVGDGVYSDVLLARPL